MTVATGGPREFDRWVRRTFDEDVPDWEAKEHRKIHLQVVNEMVKGTPVGNPDNWHENSLPAPVGYVGGRARSNWQSSHTVPKGGEPNGPNQSGYPGAGETKTLNRQSIGGLKGYSRTFITNNTPYIVALNDRPNPHVPGMAWSTQAPLQWMEAALDRVGAQFDRGGK